MSLQCISTHVLMICRSTLYLVLQWLNDVVQQLSSFPPAARADLSTFLNLATESLRFSISTSASTSMQSAASLSLAVASTGAVRRHSGASAISTSSSGMSPVASPDGRPASVSKSMSGATSTSSTSGISEGFSVAVVRASKNGHPAYEVRSYPINI